MITRIVIIFQFFITYMPSQQLQGQLEKQCSVHTDNYVTKQGNDKDNIHKASFGNSAVEILCLPYTTKKSIMAIKNKKNNANKQ
jgi:hypothetical protein